MPREPPSPAAGGSGSARAPNGRPIGWQLLQVAVLLGLLLVAMYEVDLDARALAEKRARSALASAVQAAAEHPHPESAVHLLERELGSYAKVCGACAEPRRCEETIHAIRVAMEVPAGPGPCKEGIFERWFSDEAARARREP